MLPALPLKKNERVALKDTPKTKQRCWQGFHLFLSGMCYQAPQLSLGENNTFRSKSALLGSPWYTLAHDHTADCAAAPA